MGREAGLILPYHWQQSISHIQERNGNERESTGRRRQPTGYEAN